MGKCGMEPGLCLSVSTLLWVVRKLSEDCSVWCDREAFRWLRREAAILEISTPVLSLLQHRRY